MRSNTAFNYPNILKPSSQVPPFPFHYSPRDEHGAPNLREDFQIGKKKKKTLSASPSEPPNYHENDSETNSRREKSAKEEIFIHFSHHLAPAAMRPEKEKDIKRNTGKSNRKEEDEAFLSKVNLKGVIYQKNVSEFLIKSKFKWDLDPPVLAKYADVHFNAFI